MRMLKPVDIKRCEQSVPGSYLDKGDISQCGLTQGQQTQIARNEQRTAKLLEELENLEETLNDSIRKSLGAKTERKPHGKKKGMVEDEEDLSSDEDDFYDRTKKKPSTKKAVKARL